MGAQRRELPDDERAFTADIATSDCASHYFAGMAYGLTLPQSALTHLPVVS